MKTVTEKLSNILNDFSNEKSDNVIIETTQFEKLEIDFKNYIKNKLGESFLLDLVNQMCEESLSPNMFNFWLIVRHKLHQNRHGLYVDADVTAKGIEARKELGEETFEALKHMCSNSGYTPDWGDAMAASNINEE